MGWPSRSLGSELWVRDKVHGGIGVVDSGMGCDARERSRAGGTASIVGGADRRWPNRGCERSECRPIRSAAPDRQILLDGPIGHNGHSSMKRTGPLIAVPLLAVGLAACGSTVSTSAFKGESHAVAQRVSNYQADIGAANEKKLCSEDLSSAVRRRLSAATEAGRHAPSALADLGTRAKRVSPQSVPVSASGCEQALKRQIGSIDDYEAAVKQVTVSGATATALVKSTWSGKLRSTTLELVKEGGSWRITGASLK